MKQVLLLAAIALTSSSALQAQSTLTATTNSPIPGEKFIGHFVDTTGISKGASGASVTWNFASLTTTSMDTTIYKACDSTPYCDSFAGSNIVSLMSGDYYYGTESSSGVTFSGAYTSGTYAHFSNGKDAIFYPLTYNSWHLDTVKAVISASGSTIYLTELDSFKCDAYGTITLPSGTHTNALRVHTVTLTTDSLNIAGFPIVTTTRSEAYNWYKPGFHSQLFTLTYDTTGGVQYLSEAKYYVQTGVTGVGDVASDHASLTLYPNPATDMLHLQFNLQNTMSASVIITDIMGRKVGEIGAADMKIGMNDISYSLASLSSGTYLVQLHTTTGVEVQKVTIQK